MAAPERAGRFSRALRWAYVMTIGRQVGAAAVTFILAALLGPEAFGVVALAGVYVAFLEMFLEQGLTNALIQRKDLHSDHLDTVFWTVLALSLGLCGLSVALAPVWAASNQLPALESVIAALSLTLPIRGLVIVQRAWMQREMDFKALAIRTNVSTLVSGAVGIAMAFQGFGVWALVAQQVTYALAELVLLWSMSAWRPRLRISRQAMVDLLGFSTGAFLSRLGLFAHRRVDILVMGVAFGPVAVGLYRIAERIMSIPLEMATRAVQSVSFSEFSRLQDDEVALRAAVERSLWVSASLSVPTVLGIGAVSQYLLPLLGEEWVAASGALRLLCVVGAVTALTTLSGPVLQGVGRPHTMAAFVWSWGAVSAVSALTVAWWVEGASVAEQVVWIAGVRAGVALLLHVPVQVGYMLRVAGIRWSRFFAIVLPSTTSGLVAFAVVAACEATGWPRGQNPLVALLMVGIPAGLATVLVLVAMDRSVRDVIRETAARLRENRATANVPEAPEC